MITGLLVMWIGIDCVGPIYGLLDISDDTYFVVRMVLSIFVMVFAFDSFRRGAMTEGIMIMYIGLSSISTSIGALILQADNLALMDLQFSIALFIVSFIFAYNRRYGLSVSAFILALSMVYLFVSDTADTNVFFGIGMLVSGTLLTLHGLFGLIMAEAGKTHDDAAEEKEERDIAYELVVIPGMFAMGMHGIMSAFSTYDTSFYVYALFLAALILTFSVYALTKGIALEGTMMLMYASSVVIFAGTSLAGFDTYAVMDSLFAAAIFVCGIAFLVRKDYSLAIAALAFGIFVVPGPLLGSDICWSIGSIIMAVILLYYSVSRWVLSATGKAILPIVR